MPTIFNKHFSLLLALPVSLSALTLGCSSRGQSELIGAKGAALHQVTDCGDLLEQIQADAIAKLDLQVAQAKTSLSRGGVVGTGGLTGGVPDSGSDASGDLSLDGDGASEAPSAGGDAVDDGGAGPEDHSETNTQVKGVDEADIVKTDGERIYLLHGDELFLLDSWPAEQTALLGSAKVEGNAFEMFVHDGQAVVFSSVFPTDVPGASGGTKPAVDCIDCYGYGNNAFTKVSVFDVTGEVPQLTRELMFEGYYISGRRHDDIVRTVVQGGFKATDLYYPNIDYYDSFGRPKAQAAIDLELSQWRDCTVAEIESTVLDDWVPRRFEKDAGKWAELPLECESYFVPEPGRVQNGVTQVVTFDATKRETPHVVAVLGGAETVYANHDVLLLGQTDYSWDYQALDSTRTLLHEFKLDGAQSAYQASGFVPGYLHNQFSIDEADGVVRLSTTETVITDRTRWVTETNNRVYTLQTKGKDLKVLGRSEAVGEAGETIFATRFIGDRAYVVTFLQTDPLVVVDLADPTKPTVVGELHIPGFSEYIHPLPNHQLLTIGQGVDENGSQNGVALQIFDVSNPNEPVQAHVLNYGGFSYSEAGNNHKAFTFMEDKLGADHSLLMFPITSYDPVYTSRLELVDVSAADGFAKLGSIDHADLLLQTCQDIYTSEFGNEYCYYGGNDMRRGVEVGGDDEDYIYAISYGGITVHPLSSPSTVAATVQLPAPAYSDNYYYGGGGAVDGGSTGVADDGGDLSVDPPLPE